MNRAFLCYKSVKNVIEFAAPSAIFIPHINREDPAFQLAHEKGADVLPYFNTVETPTTPVSPLWEAFYMGASITVPRWPYKDASGNARRGPSNTQVTHLLDIRVGSAWPKFAAEHIGKIVRAGPFSGPYLDAVGGQLFGAQPTKFWPVGERQEWEGGAVDMVRLIYEACHAEGRLVMNNNTWQHAPEGERYVDGICIEHPTPLNTEFFKPYARRAYGDGSRRRVLVITNTKAETEVWRATPGVTHIAQTNVGYAEAQPVDLPYTDLRAAELSERVALLHSENVAMHTSLMESSAENADLRKSEAAARAKIEAATVAVNNAAAALS